MKIMRNTELLYELQPGETYAFFKPRADSIFIIIAHPEHPPKLISSEGEIIPLGFATDEGHII